MAIKVEVPIRPVTGGPKHHFFGYYDKHQFDVTDRYILGLETSFKDRSPRGDDVAVIGMIDLLEDNRFTPLAETRAWCWQQGCMLQWLPGSTDEIIYNDRIGDRFVACILNVKTGARRTLPRGVYTVSADGKWALSLNWSRLATHRPGYGYNGLHDHWADDKQPAEDGIYLMELATGNHHLVVSIADLARRAPTPAMADVHHWVNHLLFNPSGERFIFLHRWHQGQRGFETRMYTASRDGSDLYLTNCLSASHFIWYGNDRILVWDEDRHAYIICGARDDSMQLFGADVLPRNGHCTVSPDGQWVLTDEYPDKEGMRPLILYHIATSERYDIGRFRSEKVPAVELRTDLHPRWSRNGRLVCFDSVHEGTRQMYLADVTSVVAAG